MLEINLTQEEISRYRPYHTFEAFARGYWDYVNRLGDRSDNWPGAFGQAYDRGAECAMRRQRPTNL